MNPLARPFVTSLAAPALAAWLAWALSGCATTDSPPGQVQPPRYSILIGQGGAGSGFHFSTGGDRYIACSLHQSGGAVPASFGSWQFLLPIMITERVATGKDVQILSYASPELDRIPALAFDPNVSPAVGDAVFCYDGDRAVRGQIVSVETEGNKGFIKLERPFPAHNKSGSPVVHARTGTVIGVVLSAVNPEAATILGFELLPLPPKAGSSTGP